MTVTRALHRIAALSLTAFALSCAQAAEDWPDKPITLVVPFPAGGGTDIVARAVGQHLSEQLQTPVVVENKPGAATAIGAEFVARAAPDGNTLLVSGASTFSINPAIRSGVRYDPLQDFVPLGIVAKVPLLLMVNVTSPYESVEALVAAARAKPGSLNYATYGSGSAPHLAASLFSLAAGINMTEIGYRGSSPALVALLAGEVDMTLDTAAAVGAQTRAGKLRALANFSAERASAFPEVATLRELGLPDATFEGWFGIAAPKGTPPAIIERLSAAIQDAMQAPAVMEQLTAQSIEPAHAPGPQMQQQIESELTRYRALAQQIGLELE